MRPGLLLFLLLCLTGQPARAVLGETQKDLERRLGKPQSQPKQVKSTAIWLVEGIDGQLAYNVTFDAQGRSIAEGVRPVRYAQFPKDLARDFIRVQLDPYRDSTTRRTYHTGENYTFADRVQVAGPNETVIVDEPNDLIIVWNNGARPSVIAARSVIMR